MRQAAERLPDPPLLTSHEITSLVERHITRRSSSKPHLLNAPATAPEVPPPIAPAAAALPVTPSTRTRAPGGMKGPTPGIIAAASPNTAPISAPAASPVPAPHFYALLGQGGERGDRHHNTVSTGRLATALRCTRGRSDSNPHRSEQKQAPADRGGRPRFSRQGQTPGRVTVAPDEPRCTRKPAPGRRRSGRSPLVGHGAGSRSDSACRRTTRGSSSRRGSG
jgi:hypothetical protein